MELSKCQKEGDQAILPPSMVRQFFFLWVLNDTYYGLIPFFCQKQRYFAEELYQRKLEIFGVLRIRNFLTFPSHFEFL